MEALGAQYNILESEIASIKTVTASAIDVFKSLILKLKAAEEDYSLPEYEEDEEVRVKMAKQKEITEITTKLQREKKAAKQVMFRPLNLTVTSYLSLSLPSPHPSSSYMSLRHSMTRIYYERATTCTWRT